MFGNGLTTQSLAKNKLPLDYQQKQAQWQPQKTETTLRQGSIRTDGGEEYFLAEQLSAGGFGSIYRARRRSDGLTVALKLPKNKSSQEAHTHLIAETTALQSLHHRHLIKLLDCGYTVDGEPFLALELVEAITLQELLGKDSVLPIERVVNIGRQIAEALEYVHSAGFIHNDLKPSNIMIDSNDFIRVLDFGITSKFGDNQDARGSESSATLLYMSPEQMTNLPTNPRSDLYQLGLLLFRCLTGRMPFENSMESLLGFRLVGSSIAQQELVKLSCRAPRLAALVDRTLAPRQIDRIKNARTLAHHLELLQEEDASMQAGLAA